MPRRSANRCILKLAAVTAVLAAVLGWACDAVHAEPRTWDGGGADTS